MRSRYTAYATRNVDYIASTWAPESRSHFNRRAAERWAAEATWLGLQVLATENGQPGDREGIVEFVATYQQSGKTIAHHERSRFRKSEQGEWLFAAGETDASRTDGVGHWLREKLEAAQKTLKVGRNDLCSCGSGKKYKKCCGA
jgi:SEC-C motif-containing protein